MSHPYPFDREHPELDPGLLWARAFERLLRDWVDDVRAQSAPGAQEVALAPLAEQLHLSWIGFVGRRAARDGEGSAQAWPPGGPEGTQSDPGAADGGGEEPPAHWLADGQLRGAPAHWLEHIREVAPHLLEEAGLPGSRGGEADEPLHPVERLEVVPARDEKGRRITTEGLEGRDSTPPPVAGEDVYESDPGRVWDGAGLPGGGDKAAGTVRKGSMPSQAVGVPMGSSTGQRSPKRRLKPPQERTEEAARPHGAGSAESGTGTGLRAGPGEPVPQVSEPGAHVARASVRPAVSSRPASPPAGRAGPVRGEEEPRRLLADVEPAGEAVQGRPALSPASRPPAAMRLQSLPRSAERPTVEAPPTRPTTPAAPVARTPAGARSAIAIRETPESREVERSAPLASPDWVPGRASGTDREEARVGPSTRPPIERRSVAAPTTEPPAWRQAASRRGSPSREGSPAEQGTEAPGAPPRVVHGRRWIRARAGWMSSSPHVGAGEEPQAPTSPGPAGIEAAHWPELPTGELLQRKIGRVGSPWMREDDGDARLSQEHLWRERQRRERLDREQRGSRWNA
jgi:hypothetical protein